MSDIAPMMELIKELALYEKAPDEVSVSLEEFAESGFGESPVWEAYVAELDERIVGMSLFYIRYSTWKGRKLYLEDIVVSEEYRGRGIGARLFEATVKLGKSRGYHGIVWQVLDWNEPAINFYKKYDAKFDPEWVNCSIDF